MHRFSYVHNVRSSPPQYRTIPDCIKEKAEDVPNAEAFVFLHEDSGRTSITWKQLYERSFEFAKSLVLLGVNEKDVVAISGPNCPEWLYASFGTMMARAIPATINFTYSDGSDVVAMLKKLESCTTFILHPGFENKQWRIMKSLLESIDENGNIKCQNIPSLKTLIFMAKPTNEGDLLLNVVSEMIEGQSQDLELPRIYPEDIAYILQTSGSTGVPKPLAHTHFSLTGFFFGGNIDVDNKMYNDRNFGWIGGFPFTVCTGGVRITPCYLNETTDYMNFMIKSIHREKCTWAFCLPSLLKELLDRQVAVGTVCKTLFVRYGSSESLLISVKVVTSPEEYKSFSAGHVIKGMEVKIVDNEGHPVSIGTRGEIYVRSSTLFLNYVNDPDKTRKSKTESGWYKTDDVGYLTETGELFVEGRKSDIIICGGLNITPSILESLLKTFPGVEDVAVVPVSHPTLFQVVCACIVPKAGSGLTEEAVRTFCKEKHVDKAGRFTVFPSHYIFLDEFPKHYTGKIDKKSLEHDVEMRFGVNSC
ncbi:hypothetical protein ACJMK2_043569 [Sinanodonta woodiana]|uniref:Acyl-CoA synthetase family member 2, mitochondrial n=1 Tax=Sinanodonta woodiana TaxID=1069815 RepID=A0ABD3VXB9_SINWO